MYGKNISQNIILVKVVLPNTETSKKEKQRETLITYTRPYKGRDTF